MKREMIVPKALLVLVTVSLVFCGQCTSFNAKEDYHYATHHLCRGDVKMARKSLPEAEKKNFISLMEKTYLSLLAGDPNIDELAAYAQKVDRQIRYKVSREIQSFFYLETPEGYYASEHEIVWMHMLLSWGYSLRGDYEKAQVEARIASNLLSTSWSETGRFDDPLLRVILAGLWTMSGRWDEAQVDFRRAYEMDKSLKWAHKLGERDSPPARLILLLGGVGQECLWSPELRINPFRGFRGITFRRRGKGSRLTLTDASGMIVKLHLTPDSSPWYVRHFVRDNEIRSVIEDSRYGQRALASTVKGTTLAAAGIAAGVARAAGGVAVGGGLVYAGAKLGSGELLGAGVVVGIVGIVWGADFAADSVKGSVQTSREEMDIARTYRFVRFLPEYAWVGWSPSKPAYPLVIRDRKVQLGAFQTGIGKDQINGISFLFFPDAEEREADKEKKANPFEGLDKNIRDLKR